jgi:hypothetical protein
MRKKKRKKKKLRRKERKLLRGSYEIVLLQEGTTFYGYKCSQAVPARPSGKGIFEVR